MIREIKLEDASRIAEIYNYYIEHTVITFEETVLKTKDMEDRILEITEDNPWYVYEEDGKILGYSYAGKWKGRCAFRFSLEGSVYLDHRVEKKGIGSKLYSKLLKTLKERGIHIVVAGISLPNEKSIALHEKFGFKKVGQFSEVGYKFSRWIDVGYWELNLEKI